MRWAWAFCLPRAARRDAARHRPASGNWRRTVFNILGPLTNPARAQHQLVGVYDGSLTAVMAMVLHNLGAKRAFVVHGSDGLDELTTTGVSTVSELRGGRVHTYTVHPGDFGLPSNRPEELRGGDAIVQRGLDAASP